jgi:Fe-S-cluster-containing dehydrogenase component
MKKKSMLIDLDRCIGCFSCEVACKNENNIDLGIQWNKVFTIGPTGVFPDLEMYFLPSLCQACDSAPCVAVCPTGASHVNAEGVILVDHQKCIGCMACITACPYKARSFNTKSAVVEKCTLCDHLKAPDKPACVKACCAKARFVGDFDDPGGEIQQRIKKAGEKNVHALPDAGNSPTVRYILSEKTAKWHDRKTWVFFPEKN